MKKNYPNDDFLLRSISSITKIKGSYREYKHSGDFWENYRNDESCPRKTSTRRDKSRRNEFSQDEALVNSLDGSNARQAVRKLAPTTIGKIKQKSTNPVSPASCLKTTCSKKKDGVKKKVLFTETSCSPTSEDCYDYWGSVAKTEHPSQDYESDYDYDWYPSNSSSQGGRGRPRSGAVSSSSATVYAETTSTNVSASTSVSAMSSATSNELDAKLARLKRDCTQSHRSLTPGTEPFRRTILHQGDGGWRSDERSVRSSQCSHVKESSSLMKLQLPKDTVKLEDLAAKSKTHSTSESRRSSRRLCSSASARCTHGSSQPSEALESGEEVRLLEDLERMALTSSTCCSGPTLPRIVKSRDVLKRVAIRRMLAYPPQGQSGEPLTLLKKWSNIDCHVQGDSQKGFRYKVYYLQEFESSPWYPDEKTGSPFHIDDEVCSTDYG